jgi:hypothetical protein
MRKSQLSEKTIDGIIILLFMVGSAGWFFLGLSLWLDR